MPMDAIFTSHNTVSTETTFCHDQSRKKKKKKRVPQNGISEYMFYAYFYHLI